MNTSSEQSSSLSATKRALLALREMQSKLDAIQYAKTEPVAIIGLGCRFPGGGDNPEAFWKLLHDGVDAAIEVPKDRWDINAYYDVNPDASGKMYSRHASFLKQVDEFEPQFFGIAPREAVMMDPQQRLLLEVCWESIEYAGLSPAKLRGSQTGVFLGVMTQDYSQLISNSLSIIDIHSGTGNAISTAAGRLAYFLGIHGPTLTVDTACSSSLVATHLACQSLRLKECDIALACGVNLMLTPYMSVVESRARMLSPDGRCKTFDATADGMGRGEGCGVIMLKRLSDAIADGDRVLALIRGSAVNQDGPSSGLTVPNSRAQKKLIDRALKSGVIDPNQVDYVEAHGTGTSLGDPIEVEALAAVYGKNRSQKQPLIISSVKTNIGHLEGAAGIAGLIKVVLALQHQEIPPHLHFKQPNPQIPWDELPVAVPVERIPWLKGSKQRLAGVSSFGFSGTNAHVILEEAPVLEEISATQPKGPAHLLTLSAKSEIALKELVSRYHKHLTTHPELGLEDICFTTNSGRSHFNHRLSLVASSNGELTDKLAAVSTREEVEGVFLGQQQNTVRSKIGFLFTGQGCQYVGMAKQLYETQPKFREALLKCEQIVRPYLEESLLSVLYPEIEETSPLNQTAYTQPALFAIEYALFELWKSWGISPEIVMGHSLGEYVAATVAGVFSLEDGLKLVATRARLMQALPKTGEMMVVFAELAQVQKLIESYRQEVSIAAINGPQSVVISGSGQALAKIRRDLEAVDVKSKTLEVSHPFHSPLMEPMLKDFAAVASSVKYSKPKMELISNLTGELADDRIASSQYWVDHVRSPVQFARSMETLVGQKGYECFVEIGPKPILLGMGRQCFSEDLGIWLPSLHPQKDDWQQMLSSLGQLYVKGVDVDWSGFKGDYCFNKVILPTYPFQRQRYWVETPTSQITSASASQANQLVKLHPLLNKKFQSPLSADIFFESNFSTKALPFLEDHRVYQQVVVPAACHISLLLQAAKLSFATDSCLLEDILFPQALAIAQDKELTVQLVLTPEKIGASFKLISFDNNSNFGTNTAVVDGNQTNPWVLHATGKISAGNNITTQTLSIPQIQQRCPTQMESSQLYQTLLLRQIQLGVSFRCIDSIWVGDREALCQIKLPNIIDDAANYQLHPVVIDSCLQLLVAAATSLLTTQDSTFVPFSIEKFEFYHPPISGQLWCHAYVLELEESEAQTLVGDICLFDCNGQIIAQLSGFQAKKATVQTFLESSEDSLQDWFYEVEWIPKAGFGNPLPLEYLSTPAEIEREIYPQIQELIAQAELKGYGEAFTQLEIISVDYILKAFKDLGWQFQLGQRFSKAFIAERLGVVPQHHRLLGRLLEILAEVEILQSIDGKWEVTRTPHSLHTQQQINSLLTKYPSVASELTLLERCGSRLAVVLQGEIDPVQLIFPEGDFTTASALYQDSPGAKVMNNIVQQTVLAAVEHLPKTHGVRVLEIGAGTGGTTAHLLPHLDPAQTEYVFTDISTLFISKAQEKFQDFPFVRYQTLDIEKNPADQGFESHQYDIIVAANVLHATQDLQQTLLHVQQLLASGGMLVLLEGTTKTRWVDLIFGLLDGWWRFRDVDLRPEYPLLTASQWQVQLQSIGFSKIATICAGENQEVFSQKPVVIAAQAVNQPSLSASSQPKRWLILAERQGIGQQLAAQLCANEEICTVVFPGQEYQELGEDRFVVNPSRPEDFQQLIHALTAQQSNLHGVVHCFCLDPEVKEDLNSEELQAFSQKGCGSTLHLIQALVWAEWSQLPRLWLVTRGAQPVNSDSPVVPGVGQSSLWGMGKAIALEYPELQCKRVDLDPQTGNEVQFLWEEILKEDPEEEIAFRGRTRYVARLVRRQKTKQLVSEKLLAFRGDSTYLITGGFGGLGLLVARWMVERGARHLVLLGRSGASAAISPQLRELEQAGASVTVAVADVSNAFAIGKLFSQIEESLPPLRGVIHSAGVLDDGVLQQQSWERFVRVMAPKVEGTWNLHTFTREKSLDFFVLFSSATSVLGSAGQANHAAANAFLDALAYYRQALGLPGLSINWGAVAEVGAAAQRQADERAKKKGIGAIAPQKFLTALELLMSTPSAQVGVMPIDWSQFKNQFTMGMFPSLVSELLQEEQEQELIDSGKLSSEKTTALPSQLNKVNPSERNQLLVAYLQTQVAKVLGNNISHRPQPDRALNELGLDSLMGVELKNKIKTDIGINVPMQKFAGRVTITQLVGVIVEQLELMTNVFQSKESSGAHSEDMDEIIL